MNDAMLGVVPAGLDGNPAPLVTPERAEVLRLVAMQVSTGRDGGTLLVAIDGAGGTGKSTFGDELAGALAASGTTVIRSSIDSFHRPRAQRYRRGKESPEGYYLDSHDLPALRAALLDPLRSGRGWFRRAVFDEPSDSALEEQRERVPADGVLVFDGLFLHRAEFDHYWDISVLLLAPQRREAAWNDYLTRDVPDDPEERGVEIERRQVRARHRRYVEGQALYEQEAMPFVRADLVIDNDDLGAPTILMNRL